MSTINNDPVISSGILHFRAGEIARTSTTPPLTFQSGRTGTIESIDAQPVGVGFRFVAEVVKGETAAAVISGTTIGGDYKIYAAMTWVVDLPEGPLYEARYTLLKI